LFYITRLYDSPVISNNHWPANHEDTHYTLSSIFLSYPVSEVKLKVKVTLQQTTKARRGSIFIALLFL